MSSAIRVEVVFAQADQAVARTLRLPACSTVADALAAAAATGAFAGVPLMDAAVGVFGRVADRGQALCDGDRVEIYRPLAVDPKASRRARARRGTSKSGRS